MHIRYHKRFEKRFKKLPVPVQNKVIATIELFAKSPTDPRLKNHLLKGSLQGFQAISVTSNMRIIFEADNEYTYVSILDVGTHNQVY